MKSIKKGIAALLAAALIMPNLMVAAVEAAGANKVLETEAVKETATAEEAVRTKTPETKTGEVGTATTEAAAKEETVAKTEAQTETPKTEDETQTEKTEAKTEDAETSSETLTETSKETETAKETEDEAETETETASEGEAPEEQESLKAGEDAIISFNTGNGACGLSKDSFKEDGSYTIAIPELNPFFPYEVQFTYEGKKENKWFMTPDDKVSVGGHDFYVHAEFDGTAVTQMSLNVAGQNVVVYPAEKEFSDDGISAYSLLPLQEKDLTIDLTGFTPVELTMVKISSIFAGENALKDTDSVVWSYIYADDYAVNQSGDVIDLSYDTSSHYWLGETYWYTKWEVLVGVFDQLAAANIRYDVTVKYTSSYKWLTSSVYKQGTDGVRTKLSVDEADDTYRDYGDYSHAFSERKKYMYISYDDKQEASAVYYSLNVNDKVFSNVKYSSMKAFEGKYTKISEIDAGKDITDKLLCKDMQQKDAGYLLGSGTEMWVTLVTYDSSQNPTGCMPLMLDFESVGTYVASWWLYYRTESDGEYVDYDYYDSMQDGYQLRTFSLYKEYPANGKYEYSLSYIRYGTGNSNLVTAAYAGKYKSIAEAAAAQAKDIKDELFGNGYTADYSKTVYFTIFVGADSDGKQEIYRMAAKAVTGDKSKNEAEKKDEPSLSSNTLVWFSGLNDAQGEAIGCDVFGDNGGNYDSYDAFSYFTIFVDKNTDITNVAPSFYVYDEKINLYADGRKQESGKSYHDFSRGSIQYTAAAENGIDSRNYWLRVIKAQEGAGQIYINSFSDPKAGTKVVNGVIFSKREVVIDGYHKNMHNILVANIGAEEIKEISAELQSDTLALDDYWTLKGVYSLTGYNSEWWEHRTGSNLAKISLRVKDTVAQGDKLSGTLTIKSGNTKLAVLDLTGTYGDPMITTKDIPDAVKFVPYGSIIQNNNRYSWNKVTYELASGKLPDGMVLKKSGEIYGVPSKTGKFKFTVRIKNSVDSFKSNTKQFTLTVVENSDKNVNNATDKGYDVTKRIADVSVNNTKDQVFVSQGEFTEFKGVYLDGIQLDPQTDYVAASGSTRITIKAETINKAGKGKHTLGVEFRAKDDESLKRAAQNFNVKSSSGGGDSSGGEDSSGGGSATGGSTTGGSTTGGGSSTNKANVTVTAANVIEEKVADRTYHSLALPSDGELLKLSFFNKVYGNNEKLLTYLDNGIGYIMDMNAFIAAGRDLNLACKKQNLEGFAQGFQTVWLMTEEKAQLSYDLSINMAAGIEYVGHPVYIFILDDSKKTFLPYAQTIVAPIGNVAFDTKKLTDFIVMIAQ